MRCPPAPPVKRKVTLAKTASTPGLTSIGSSTGTAGIILMVRAASLSFTPLGPIRTPAVDGKVMLIRCPGGVLRNGENVTMTPCVLTCQLSALKYVLLKISIEPS